MEPEQIMEQISKMTLNLLQEMEMSKSVEEKESYSRSIKNLCESLGVFLNLATSVLDMDIDDFDDLE